MIVNRRTFIPKRGCYDQLVELYKAVRERTKGQMRILIPEYGPFDVVVMEFEAPDLETFKKIEAEYWKDPESAAFFEKHMALTENGGTNEIWNVY